jgi:hypothetical protein
VGDDKLARVGRRLIGGVFGRRVNRWPLANAKPSDQRAMTLVPPEHPQARHTCAQTRTDRASASAQQIGLPIVAREDASVPVR